LYLLNYYDNSAFIRLFSKLALQKSPTKSINRLVTQHFIYLLPESSVLKQQLQVLFPLKVKLTKEIIKKKINKLLQLYGINYTINSETNSSSLLNLLVKTSRKGVVTKVQQYFPMSESVAAFLPNKSELTEAEEGIVKTHVINYVSVLS
ncbi:MAG: hypothetical protein ACKOW4_03935, partial [Aquirufa sp.]